MTRRVNVKILNKGFYYHIVIDDTILATFETREEVASFIRYCRDNNEFNRNFTVNGDPVDDWVSRQIVNGYING